MFLVFDVMEGFRHTVVDKAVSALLTRKRIRQSDVKKLGDGRYAIILEKRIDIIKAVDRNLEARSRQLMKVVRKVSDAVKK